MSNFSVVAILDFAFWVIAWHIVAYYIALKLIYIRPKLDLNLLVFSWEANKITKILIESLLFSCFISFNLHDSCYHFGF